MTAAAPRVSVGVPVFNGERYLAATLDSLLKQTYPDFELVVCDNASTDRTEEIARSYAAGDPRVRYVRNPRNVGSAGNYRCVFELARGEYFRWAAADDLFGAESLARCVDVLDAHPDVVLAYPKTRLIDAAGAAVSDYEDGLHLQSPRPSERFRQVLERLGYVNVLYGLARSAVLRQTGLLGRFVDSDVVFLAELSLHGTFWEIPEVLFFRRFHEAASSSMSPSEILTFYYADRGRRLVLRDWRHLVELFRVAVRAPLSGAERARVMRLLLRRAAWSRSSLIRELGAAVRHGVLRRATN
jgi:glycosyltransferase involved in cell wall biosynthesis